MGLAFAKYLTKHNPPTSPPPQLRQISKVPYKSIKPVRCISRLADSNFVLGRAHPEGLMWLCPIEYSLEGACSNIKGP
jgi:hypothetical protein